MRTSIARTVMIIILAVQPCMATEVVWIMLPKDGVCAIKGQRMPCDQVLGYLREQLKLPKASTVYVNKYAKTDRQRAADIADSLRLAGYSDVRNVAVGFIDEPAK
jgi:hypothetical protein